VASNATVARSATNKDKSLKENKKKDFSGCPDCGGTNWIYPSDPALGVKRCEHLRLESLQSKNGT
jgi:predicted  nucleic acid-binding Zn-ribbon protein